MPTQSRPPLRSRPLRAAAALLAAGLSLGGASCTTSYEFEPFSVGDEGGGARAPEAMSNSQFVRGVHVDLLGRTPEVQDFKVDDAQGDALYSFPIDEQATMVGALDAIGDPAPMRALLCAGLLGSTESNLPGKASVKDPAGFIREQFRTLLGREPNAYEARGFADAWANDQATGPRAVVRAIVASHEYQSR